MQGIFHKCPILRVFLPGVPRTFGQDCRCRKINAIKSGLVLVLLLIGRESGVRFLFH